MTIPPLAPTGVISSRHTTNSTLENQTVTMIDTSIADPTIAAAAEKVVRAEAVLAEQRTVTAQAREAAYGLKARTAALDAKRAAIAARRQDGDRRDGDAGELDLIALDREGLEPMQREADALLAAMEKQEAVAAREVEDARAGLAHAEDQVALAALKEHMNQLVARAMETLDAIAKTGQRLDGHLALGVLMPAADQVGRLLQQSVSSMAEAGRRVGAHSFRWVPDGVMMDGLRRAAIAGRPM